MTSPVHHGSTRWRVIRVVICQQCGYLALRRVAAILEVGAVMLAHAREAGCAVERMLAHPLVIGDAP